MASVLIASTDGTLRHDLAMNLADYGHETHFAADPLEALSLLKRTNFATVLIDLALPEPGGFSLLVRIRTEERYRYLMIVLIEARRGQVAASGLVPDTTTAVLARPVDRRILAAAMAPALVFQNATHGVPATGRGGDGQSVQEAASARHVNKLCHDVNNALAFMMAQLDAISGEYQNMPAGLRQRVDGITAAARNIRSLIRSAAAEARGHVRSRGR
jgi:CheY-like chemotaxis protein